LHQNTPARHIVPNNNKDVGDNNDYDDYKTKDNGLDEHDNNEDDK